MSAPRKGRSSRKGRQQKIKYHSILSVPLQLVDHKDLTTREKRLSHADDDHFPAGGRRSTDRQLSNLNFLWKSLSAREKDVMYLVCRGKSDAETALWLNISYSTVKSYLQTIFFKTHVRNRKELMAKFTGFDFSHRLPPTDRALDLF